MLADEYGTASNIKSRVNRLSVLGAITSVQHRLKLYTKVPPNGLVIYCGTIVTDEGKEKKVNIDFEPFKPINTSLYLCDNKFHTEALTALLADDNRFGFIVMDGNGALFGTKVERSVDWFERLKVNVHLLLLPLVSDDGATVDDQSVWRHLGVELQPVLHRSDCTQHRQPVDPGLDVGGCPVFICQHLGHSGNTCLVPRWDDE